MATTIQRRRTDYGFLWVVLVVAILMVSVVGIWAWLVSKVRQVAPRKLWTVWMLIGITIVFLGAWAWGSSTTESGVLPEVARLVSGTWYRWLPDLITLYLITCVTVMVLEKNHFEQTQRKLSSEQLRLWVWFWVSGTVTFAMAGWATVVSGAAHPGEVGLVLVPALSLDPNFMSGRALAGVSDPEALLVLILASATAIAALKFRSRTKTIFRLGLIVTTLAILAGLVDALIVEASETLGVVVYGAALIELWRRRRWFFR